MENRTLPAASSTITTENFLPNGYFWNSPISGDGNYSLNLHMGSRINILGYYQNLPDYQLNNPQHTSTSKPMTRLGYIFHTDTETSANVIDFQIAAKKYFNKLQLEKNANAISLLQGWLSDSNEDDTREQHDSLNKFKSNIDSNRLSDRKLFP